MKKRINRKLIGNLGEKIARKFLERAGYEILETNWRTKWGEIDIICKYNDCLVFVEVKTKIGIDKGTPENMINSIKLGQVQKVSCTYPIVGECKKRIDVIAVVLGRSSVLTEDSKNTIAQNFYKIKRITHYRAVYM